MAIKVNHRHRPISLVDTSQQWQRNGMITTQRDNSRQGLAPARKPEPVRIGEWLAHQNTVVAFLNLLDCPGIVVGRYGDITTV